MITVEVPDYWHVRPGDELEVMVVMGKSRLTCLQKVEVDKVEITQHTTRHTVGGERVNFTPAEHGYQKQVLTCRRRGSPAVVAK